MAGYRVVVRQGPKVEKHAADTLEERQQAELNRRLRICRGC